MNPRDLPVRFSHLKHMALSPAHYMAALEEDKDSPSMRMGRLVHAVVLGGDFVVYDGERRGKAWTEFKAAHDGADIVTASEHDSAQRIRDSVMSHPLAPSVLVGQKEVELNWEFLGRRCQSHLDVLGDGFVTDLKTSQTSEPHRFSRHAIHMNYHAQIAWYQQAMRYGGGDVKEGYVVAVETYGRYVTTVFRVAPRALEEGSKLCRLWMERLLSCESADQWPGYCQSIVDLDIAEDFDLLIGGEEVAA